MKLVEDFCAGVWGGFGMPSPFDLTQKHVTCPREIDIYTLTGTGYTIQRLYLSNKYKHHHDRSPALVETAAASK